MNEAKEGYFSSALDWVKRKSSSTVKANIEGYDKPKSYTNTATHEEVCPDISFTSSGGSRNYTEIALKQDDENQLVTRWKLLSMMASLKSGKLFLLAPRGHKAFTEKLVNDYNINAVIQPIK